MKTWVAHQGQSLRNLVGKDVEEATVDALLHLLAAEALPAEVVLVDPRSNTFEGEGAAEPEQWRVKTGAPRGGQEPRMQ